MEGIKLDWRTLALKRLAKTGTGGQKATGDFVGLPHQQACSA
jgi:hypothetical protein